MSKVKLKTSWYELFGETDSDYSESERQKRWEIWKKLAENEGEIEVINWWTEDDGACRGCIHKNGDWCNLMGLPITINPYLTMKHGRLGMACMGAGKVQEAQLELFDS